jgi:hypothetical protein
MKAFAGVEVNAQRGARLQVIDITWLPGDDLGSIFALDP